MVKLNVIVDSNEPKDIVFAFEQAGLKVDTTSLKPYCDYILGDLAIERKSSQDFYSSVYSNRLFKQMNELQTELGNRLKQIESANNELLKQRQMK